MVWEKEKLGEHGYFEEKFGLYGHEDNEFLIRVNASVGMIAAIISRGQHILRIDESHGYKTWKKVEKERTHPIAEKIITKHREMTDWLNSKDESLERQWAFSSISFPNT